MTTLQEWQKELLGLGVGTWVVHVLILSALAAMVLFAFGVPAY